MENVLLISSSDALKNRIGELIETPDRIDTVSDWTEAQKYLAANSPAVVLLDTDLVTPATSAQLVQLNNVLNKDGKDAFFVGEDDGGLDQWIQLFDALSEHVISPKAPGAAKKLLKVVNHFLGDDADDNDGADDDSGDASSAKRPTDSDDALEMMVRLPRIEDGSLDNITLGRVLYSLRVQEQTGVLQLGHKDMKRSFAFQAGRFVSSPNHDGLEPLSSAFAWNGGRFDFTAHSSLSGSPKSTFAVMIQGLTTHRGQRQLMNGLMSRMQTYPVLSQLWDERRDDIDWDILSAFLDHCDGNSSLEQIFSHFGSQVTDAFRAAAFARDTDLVVFRSETTISSVRVQYDQKSRSSSSARSLSSAGRPSSPRSSAPSKIERATGSGRKQLENELRLFQQSIESMSPHAVFGVWEGCGREVVKETYYRMVKEHHPDVYGGNVSGEVRNLAEQIFVAIRETYTELLKVEDEQTVPPPDKTTPGQRAGRKKQTTLHPGQAKAVADDDSRGSGSKQPGQQPGRPRRNSTPIGLGSEPSTAHPEYESQQKPRRSGRTGRSTPSLGANSSSSETSDTDDSSNSNWRKKRLQRLQQSSKRKRRRTTSSAGNPVQRTTSHASGSSTSSNSSEKRAQNTFNTGYKHYKQERLKEALPQFEKAHELDPGHGLYMTFLANTLFQLDPDQADRCLDLLKQAIDTENRQALPDAHLFMGNILKVQGHEHRAYRHFKRALELNPGARDAKREIRLYERRHKDDEKSGGFFKKLFKK